MSSTRTPYKRSASTTTRPRFSGTWATLCAETLAGIADPLFPALSVAEVRPPADAARAMLAGLLEPLDTPLAPETLPDWLLPHQAEAIARARAILARFGGVLVADGVGLGKTYIGLALAALERRHAGDAVAIVPAALRAEWAAASEATGTPIRIWSHTELARMPPVLASRCSLLLVDEAHAFRNPRTRRYDALARLAVGRRVALLTATPINNATADLAALVHLFAATDRFREFGVPDLAASLGEAEPGASALALGALSVCRTRRLVEQRFPELRAAFPRRVLMPAIRYDLDSVYDGSLHALLTALGTLSGGEERGGALMHLNLLRRLESSRAAFRRSLLRHRDFLAEWSRARETGIALSREDFRAAFPRHDADDSQLVLWPILRAAVRSDGALDLKPWREAIERALGLVDVAEAVPDPKLAALEALLAGALAGTKAIVFTEYRDTALHLLRHLRRRFRVIAVVGESAWTGTGRLDRSVALDAFAPRARRAKPDPMLDADVLIATDVASEGMNLQDAAAVVNYDLPWNPVRVMQRVGRVDRLYSAHANVFVTHLLPAGGLGALTGVLEKLRTKLAEVPRFAGAEPDPLAALWWVGGGAPLPETLEHESWRRVAPFEARERWRLQVGAFDAARHDPPVVAAGIVADGGSPAVGVLLALEWQDGRRIPLPFTIAASGDVRADSAALGDLAERALRAAAIPTGTGEFTSALATVLPRARAQLLEYSAVRRGTHATGPGRSAALDLLKGWAAEATRDRADTEAIERAMTALAGELPVGLDRLIGRLLTEAGAHDHLAVRIAEVVESAAPLSGPRLDGTPRLVLVAAIALATRCPAE